MPYVMLSEVETCKPSRSSWQPAAAPSSSACRPPLSSLSWPQQGRNNSAWASDRQSC